MKFLLKSKTVKMSKKEFIEEHEKLVDILNSPSHADDKKEAKKQKKELDRVAKALGYHGPITMEDITIASWNDYFREGGVMNQPVWLSSNKLKELRDGYTKLARLHS